MKKIISIFLLAVLTFTIFTACGRNNNKDNSSSLSNSSSSSRVESDSGMESFPDSQGSGMDTPSRDENLNSNSNSNSTSGDAGSSLRPGEAQNRNLDEFAMALKEELGGDYLPDTVIDSKEIEEMTGITSDMYEDIYGEKSMMDINPDIFIAVKAKENKADEVKKLLNDYKEKMIAENKTDENTDFINSTQVMQQDNFVFLFLLGKNDLSDAMESAGDKIENGIQRAEEVIKNMLS